jgi:hypothetical protein
MRADYTSRNRPDRMDLPLVGLATLPRQPACPYRGRLDRADVTVLGVAIDIASSYRVGTKAIFGKRSTRRVSETLAK